MYPVLGTGRYTSSDTNFIEPYMIFILNRMIFYFKTAPRTPRIIYIVLDGA